MKSANNLFLSHQIKGARKSNNIWTIEFDLKFAPSEIQQLIGAYKKKRDFHNLKRKASFVCYCCFQNFKIVLPITVYWNIVVFVFIFVLFFFFSSSSSVFFVLSFFSFLFFFVLSFLVQFFNSRTINKLQNRLWMQLNSLRRIVFVAKIWIYSWLAIMIYFVNETGLRLKGQQRKLVKVYTAKKT